MSTTDAPEPGTEPDRSEAVATVPCSSCGAHVAETATDVVPRRYMSVVVQERWCLLCIKAKDDATQRALQATKTDDDPDY